MAFKCWLGGVTDVHCIFFCQSLQNVLADILGVNYTHHMTNEKSILPLSSPNECIEMIAEFFNREDTVASPSTGTYHFPDFMISVRDKALIITVENHTKNFQPGGRWFECSYRFNGVITLADVRDWTSSVYSTGFPC